MRLFFRRPAAAVLATFVLLSAIGFHICPALKLTATVVFIVAVFVAGMLLRFGVGKRERLCMVIAMLVSGALALGTSYYYFDVRYMSFKVLECNECAIEGVVLERRYSNSFSDGYTVALRSLNDTDIAFDAILDCEYVSDLQPGYSFRLTATAQPLGYSSYDDSDRKRELAEGLMLRFVSSDAGTVEILNENTIGFRILLRQLRDRISAKLSRLIGGEVGDLVAAMTLGDRLGLDSSTLRDFRRAGAAHLLALSGLHMAIVMGIFDRLFVHLSVGKRVRMIILLLILGGYLALTGFSVSATRAAIMLTLVYLSYFASGASDGITSLFLAGTVILLVSPSSVIDVGFWMSFLATLGILVTAPCVGEFLNRFYVDPEGERLEKMNTPIYETEIKTVTFLITIVSCTLAANIATSVVAWLYFGKISTMTILSNLLLSPLTSLVILFGMVTILTMWIPPLGAVAAIFARPAGNLMLFVCNRLAALDGAVISLRYGFAGIIIVLMTVSVAIMLLIKLRHKYTILVPVAVAILAFVISFGVYGRLHSNELEVSYLHDGQSEMLLLSKGGTSVLCDISDGSYSDISMALARAEEDCSTELSAFVLTHYHKKHISSVGELICSEVVRELWLPRPTCEDDYYVLLSLLDVAERYGCVAVIYDIGESLSVFGDGCLSIDTARIKRSAQPIITISLTYGESTIVYVGSAADESELDERVSASCLMADHIIFGSHGPKVKSRYYYPVSDDLSSVTFADKTAVAYFAYDEYPDLSGVTLTHSPECFSVTLTKNEQR